MKVGIFLGSFDPIHLGHINLITNAMRACELDNVSLVPAWQNVAKKQSTDYDIRLNMCQCAVRNIENIYWSICLGICLIISGCSELISSKWLNSSTIEKDRLAYERAMEYYDKDIKDLMDHDRYCMIGIERKYDLQEVLCNYIRYNQKTWTFN